MSQKAVAFFVALSVIGLISVIDPAIWEAFGQLGRTVFPLRVQQQ